LIVAAIYFGLQRMRWLASHLWVRSVRLSLRPCCAPAIRDHGTRTGIGDL
jgi:hypothetical protein